MPVELFANDLAGTGIGTLGAAVATTGVTTITTLAAAPAALQATGQFRIVIDSEIMIVTGGAATTTWTVTRGVEGTTAATHGNSITIYHTVTAGALVATSESLREDYWKPTGAIAQTIERQNAVSTAAPLLSGRLHLAGGAVLQAGVPANNITFVSGATGATTPTNQWFALIDKATRQVLAYTVDDLTTAWATTAAKTLAISGGYTPTATVGVYLGIMVAAATPPNLSGANGVAQTYGIAPILNGSSNTGLTTPASLGAVGTVVAAPTVHAQLPYAYVT